MIQFMPCKNPCRLYIHLAFTYSLGPSSVVWRELGPAPPFPPMRVLEGQWSRALSLMCEVALCGMVSHVHWDYRIQVYLSSIQHKNFTSCRFVVILSQMTSDKLDWAFKAHSNVKSTKNVISAMHIISCLLSRMTERHVCSCTTIASVP
jgi:hypothetical protein